MPKCCLCQQNIELGKYYYIMQGRTTCIKCGNKLNSKNCAIFKNGGETMKKAMSKETVIRNLELMNEAIDWDIPIDTDRTTAAAIEYIKAAPEKRDCK